MIQIGFIGYGSMGSMLLNGFISSGKINQNQIIVSTKTKSKLETIKAKFDQIHIAQSNMEVAQKAKYIFICVKPLEVKSILAEISKFATSETHIISIAASVTIKNIEEIINGKITKIIPSLTSEVKEGISLVCHNNIVSKNDAAFVESLLGGISVVKIIDENNLETATEITSCGPGLIAAMFQEFVNAGLRHSNLSREDVEEMVIRTFSGTAKLMLEENMKFEDIINRVATKGGITEEGVKILKTGLPKTFDEMFYQTRDKRRDVAKRMDE
jgi:pyrroline-5-carboxylate reductase